VLLEITDPTLLGVAAIITSFAGVVTTIIGARRSAREAKEKADEDCFTRLRDLRSESEKIAEELHRMRMSQWREQKGHFEEAEVHGWEEADLEAYRERWSHMDPGHES
jgi:hypothetical protein